MLSIHLMHSKAVALLAGRGLSRVAFEMAQGCCSGQRSTCLRFECQAGAWTQADNASMQRAC